MRTRLICIVLVLHISLSPALISAQERSGSSRVITGTVTDDKSGSALQGVSVSANGDQGSETVSTDRDGTFTLPLTSSVKPGDIVVVHFEKVGYGPLSINWTVSSGALARPIKMHRITGSKPSKPPQTASVRERSLILSDDIRKNGTVKERVVGLVSVKHFEDTTDGFREHEQELFEANQREVSQFRKELGPQLEQIIVELRNCGAPTGQVEKQFNELTKAREIGWLGLELERTAYDFPDNDLHCAGLSKTPDKETGLYTIRFGAQTAGYSERGLKQPFAPFGIGAGNIKPITVYFKDGVFYADVRVYESDGSGRLLYEILGKKPYASEPYWDMNTSDTAIEIVDSEQNPWCQMIFDGTHKIEVYLRLPVGKGQYQVIGPNLGAPLTRVFKYPSYEHMHEYSDK
jgi:hypothetical protein